MPFFVNPIGKGFGKNANSTIDRVTIIDYIPFY